MERNRINRMDGSGTPYGVLIPKRDRKKPQQDEVSDSPSDDRNNPDASEQMSEAKPSGESRRPVTNQDEQHKATNIDDNNDIVE